jgi:hypothetical protein
MMYTPGCRGTAPTFFELKSSRLAGSRRNIADGVYRNWKIDAENEVLDRPYTQWSKLAKQFNVWLLPCKWGSFAPQARMAKSVR